MAKKTHGFVRGSTLERKAYRAWVHMRDRCSKESDPGFKWYGGRGISVHPEWQSSFEAFIDYIGLPPTKDHSLDRYPDNDGNYEPGNVRWATSQQQNKNKRQGNQEPVKTLMWIDRIKELSAQGLSTRKIAAQVGVNKSQVWKVIAGHYDPKG